MTDTLQALGRQMSTDVDTLSSISRNVANLQTPGYRAERMRTDFAQQTGLTPAVDQRDGSLAQTGRALDLALRGQGFFAVERQGQPMLVRAWQLPDRCRWLSGHSARRPRAGSVGRAADRSEPDHRRHAAARRCRRPALGRPAAARSAADRGGCAAIGAARNGQRGPTVTTARRRKWQGSVVQGVLEAANVDPADEMLRLMELTRHVDAVRRAMSTYDQMLDTGINRIGEN